MINEQILKKAIEKAVKNGWNGNNLMILEEGKILWVTKEYYQIIFSHDFAKAFWGTELNYRSKKCLSPRGQNWQYHLQQMVLEKEPLKYLERFL